MTQPYNFTLGLVNTQTVGVLPTSNFFMMSQPENERFMHMDHQPPFGTKYWVSGDVLSVGLSHYSPDVPCDFANFVDHLLFH